MSASKAMAKLLEHHREALTVDDAGVAAHFIIAIAEGGATGTDHKIFNAIELEERALLLTFAALTTPSPLDVCLLTGSEPGSRSRPSFCCKRMCNYPSV
jgi:hypothetical protein